MRPKLRFYVYCGKDKSAGKLSSEHFVPKCLWETKPVKIKTVRAHIPCNKQFSDDNEYFRDMLAFEHHEHVHPELQRIRDIVIKSKMENHVGSLAKSLATAKERPVVTKSGIYLGHQPTVILDTPRINRVLENIVRGLYYHQTDTLLSTATKVRVYWPKELQAPEIQSAIDYMRDKPWHSFGDDAFLCKWVFNPAYPESMACLMQFYRSRVYFGWTMPDGLADMVVKKIMEMPKASAKY